MKNRSVFLELAQVLAPGIATVAGDLAQVFDDRTGYLKKRARALDDRNVNAKRTPADLPWLALVLALTQAKRVAPVDWKASLPDLLAALDRLVTRPKQPTRWSWTRTADVAGRSTLELLELVGQRLRSDFGLVLGQIDIPSDSHELFLAPTRAQNQLVALAKRAGGRLDFFTGQNLAKLERSRLAEQKREALRERKNPDTQRQFVHPDGRVCITWGESWSVNGKRQYSLDVVHRTLGVETGWNAPGTRKRICETRSDIAKWRKPLIERCLREGYVELSLADFDARDRAARPRAKSAQRNRALSKRVKHPG